MLKKILITGGSGFVGKELIYKVLNLGHEVVNVDIVSSNISGITEIIHDLSIEPIDIGHVDACFHLASAAGGILFNHKSNVIHYNDMINRNIISSCTTPVFLFISSVNVFESSNNVNIITSPISPYAVSKFVGEGFFKSHQLENMFIVRPTNIFGKSQMYKFQSFGESHVIPDLINKIQKSPNVEVWGDGTQLRNFLHVSDLCNFMIKIVNELPSQKEFNVKSQITVTIKDLVYFVAKFMNTDINMRFNVDYMKYELMDIRKIIVDMIDIGSVLDIESGLNR